MGTSLLRRDIRNYLIAIEGIDGSGKTTVAKIVVEKLREWGYPATYTYEPFDKRFVEILEREGPLLGPIFEALVMAADRYYHIERVIKPALEGGDTVVLDRYHYSSIAYQGARGADVEWIKKLNAFVIKPDLAIYLDIPPRVGVLRKRKAWEVMEKRKLGYLERIDLLSNVRELYLRLVGEGELVYVDANRGLEDVIREVLSLIKEKLGIRG
ncbi:MAG: dTMP kinase [Desulfurococcales archaeon ex4484_204]|nr:MAG: dTMP kinase [Desulfurococcales archaeon ex4484_204]